MWKYPVEARAQLAISEQLRPSKATVYRVFGQTYYVERNYTNAVAWERKALDELGTHDSVAFYTIGTAYQAMRDYSNALDNLELNDIYNDGDAPGTRKRYARLRQALNEAGPQGYWQERWKQTGDHDYYWKAVAQLHLGNTNAGLSWLEKSCAAHERWWGSYDGPLSYLLLDECWDGLRENPRFKELLDKIGFTKVMPSSPPGLRRTS